MGNPRAFIDEFVGEGSGGLSSANVLLFGPDGLLYLGDFFGPGGNGAVLRYDGTTGAFIDEFVSSFSGGLNAATGLAFFPVVMPTEIWSQQEGTAGDDSATAVAVRDDGVYVAGVTTGTLPGQISSGGQDAFLRKYDLDGGLICTDQYGTNGDETVTGMKVTDTAVYVSGDTTGVFPGERSFGGTDLYVREYDLNCQAGWTTQYGTTEDDLASKGLGLTPDGTSLFAAGITDPGSGGDNEAILQKLDLNGNLGCHTTIGTFGLKTGGVVVNSPAVLFAVTIDGGSFGGTDGLVSQYDLNCQETWTTTYGTVAGDEKVAGIGVGPDDNAPEGVFVGGTTTGAFPDKINAGGSDFVLQKFNFVTGQLDWTRQYGTVFQETGGVVVNSPFVWIGGTTTGALPGFENAGGTDIVIRKYDLDGNELYTFQSGTDEDDQIVAMDKAPDATSIFVVGDTMGAFAGQSNQGGQDFFVKRLEVTSDPIVLLKALIDLVKDADIRPVLRWRLVGKLRFALHNLKHHRPVLAKRALRSFIRIVERRRGSGISEADADRFIEDAQAILEILNDT